LSIEAGPEMETARVDKVFNKTLQQRRVVLWKISSSLLQLKNTKRGFQSAIHAPHWTQPHCIAFMVHQHPVLLEQDMQIFHGIITRQSDLKGQTESMVHANGPCAKTVRL